MSLLTGLIYYIHLYFDYFIDFLYGLYYSGKKQVVSAPKHPILQMSATEMARKIRDGKLKSEQAVRAHVERMKEVHELLNAVIDERFDLALEEAKKVDEDIAKGVYSAQDFETKVFLGVPFTTKGTTKCKGLDISFGLICRKGLKGDKDADIVTNMKEAGGILIALTNVPQLSIWIEAHNPVFGITKNPYDTTRNVGGSSGGESCIVAACGSAIGVGTDIGGSIRIPSYMCGLFGHKCSSTLTSTKGLTFRDGSEKDRTMVVAGPIVRHSEDLIPGIKAILGPEHKKLQLDKNVDVKTLRYYYIDEMTALLCSPVRPEIKETVHKVVNHFGEIAGTVKKLEMEEFKSGMKLYNYSIDQEGNDFSYDITGRKGKAVWYKELFKYIFGKSELAFAAIMFLINSNVMPKVDPKWAEETISKMKKDIQDKLGDDGVLLCVSQPTTAHYHHVSYFRPFNVLFFSMFNMLKMPVTQVPLGLASDGLPLGIQVVAAPYQDHLCVAVARELEKTFGGYVPPFART